jgi:RNA polymerase sigma factor (sigma-70 family)
MKIDSSASDSSRDPLEVAAWIERASVGLGHIRGAPFSRDDVAQQAFFLLWRKYGAIQHGVRCLTRSFSRRYIGKIVRNTLASLLRKRVPHPLGDGDGILSALQIAEQGDAVVSAERIKALLDAVAKLSLQEKTVAEMSFFEDVETKEIARRLRLRESTVRNILMRARRKVAAALRGKGFESD